MRLLLLAFLFLSTIFNTKAQSCQGPGGTPTQANAVCGNLTFVQNQVFNCTGAGNIPNNSSGCGDIVTTDNSIWYKFHCYQAGNMGFVLTPKSLGDDFDWAIIDITGHNPNDVYTTELWVSLNLSGQTGKTGCTPGGTLNVHCAGGASGSQFNQLLNLVTGHDYLLMVNNWSSSGQGYNIDFSGTAVLTDNAIPTITNVATVGCDASKIKVTFSEDMLCNTITTTGSEFTITGGPNVISGVTSDCLIGANSVPYLIINLQAPLAPNNYTLTIADGSDGNTFENVCRRLLVPTSIPFSIPAPVPLDITNVSFSGCAPSFLDVQFNKPFECNSVTSNGSEFSIVPANAAVSSVTYNCVGGRADKLRIYFQNQLPYGNYQLVVNAGADANTIRDTCGNDMPAGYSVPVVIPQTTTPPVITSVDFDECHPKTLVLNFDKVISCNSIAANGSDFSISPGAWPIVSATPNCGSNTYTSQVTLTLQNPLPGGNFSVNVNSGADANTISDTCFSFIAPGYAKSFLTTQAPAPIFDSVQYDKCEPSVIKVFYDKPIACNSVLALGAQWYITGPTPVTVTGASAANCSTLGYSNSFDLQLSAPITTFGTYVLHNRTFGGSTITDTCSAIQNPNETISFNVLGKPSAAFNSQVIWACEMDTIIFSHPGGNGVNSWEWVFSDGTTASGQVVRHAFPITTLTVNAQLTVSNGYCSATDNQDITLGNTFTPAFTQSPLDTTCINTPVTFTDASIGTGLQYLWQFGDNTQFIGQNPPPHVYTTAADYGINLIVTDSHGCRDTASSKMVVTPMGTVDFIGLKPQYCTSNTVFLTREISRNIDSVIWNNGIGDEFINYRTVQFKYPDEGVYTITLTGRDKYCGMVQVSKPVAIYAIPKVDLGRDTVLCPNDALMIGVANNPAYNYSWNTGAITSQVTTDIFTRKYVLTVDNHTCKASDTINIKMLNACLIKVAGAFSPNGDGKNDKLLAMNADLAKAFQLRVYNRFGQMIFTTNNPLEGWDGTYKGVKAETGTYVWELSYIDPWTNKPVLERGTSILIR